MSCVVLSSIIFREALRSPRVSADRCHDVSWFESPGCCYHLIPLFERLVSSRGGNWWKVSQLRGVVSWEKGGWVFSLTNNVQTFPSMLQLYAFLIYPFSYSTKHLLRLNFARVKIGRQVTMCQLLIAYSNCRGFAAR